MFDNRDQFSSFWKGGIDAMREFKATETGQKKGGLSTYQGGILIKVTGTSTFFQNKIVG